MEKTFTITNEAGLQSRPATLLVNTASRFASDIFLIHNNQHINLKSIMGVMSLGLAQGEQFTLSIEGEDDIQALSALTTTLASLELGA